MAEGIGHGLSSACGQRVQFRKTLSESDVYLFAGITGDLHPNHIDELYMSTTPYAHRIVHGALLVGFMSTTSTLLAQRDQAAIPRVLVSYGYDRIRFIKPVYIGDTITVDYTQIVNGWIEAVAGANRIVIMYLMVLVLTIAGDFLDGVPAIAIFMPIILALTQLGHINPVHMGVLIIVSLAFGLITPPYGLILLLASTLAGGRSSRGHPNGK